MMKTTGLALLLAAGAAQAQATRMMMPEGTYDMVFGVGVQSTFRSGRDGGSQRVVVPALEVQWSNGVFVDVNVREAVLGVYLSDHPTFHYGVMAAVSGREQRADTPGQRGGTATQAGAFLHWSVEHNIGIDGYLIAGGGIDGGGLVGHARARYYLRLRAHHGAALGVGVFLGDHSWQQGYFGVTQAQAEHGGNRTYRARAGVINYFADAEWRWEPRNKYALHTGLRYSWLGSSPSASPVRGAQDWLSLRTTLTYHF